MTPEEVIRANIALDKQAKAINKGVKKGK